MIGVYGSNGFIGRHLVRRLAIAGLATRAISRRHDPEFVESVGQAVEFIEADLTNTLAMTASLQDIDTVVQMISTSNPSLGNDHTIADIRENLIPHVAFLRDCIQAGVRRYIFLSSGGTVYGPGAITPTPESAPVDPICSHGLTKLLMEKYIQMHGHVDGLEYVVMRLANPYGPGQKYRKGQGFIPAILVRQRKGLPIRIFGAGQARRDFVYIDDVVAALEAAIRLPAAPKLILNIGSGQARSVAEVVDSIECILGVALLREYVGARETDVDVSCLDISRAAIELQWTPRTAFATGLERTVRGDADAAGID